jgi:hypothetical protein
LWRLLPSIEALAGFYAATRPAGAVIGANPSKRRIARAGFFWIGFALATVVVKLVS